MRSDRLLVLAAHLKSDRRGHKIFDFGCYSVGVRDPKRNLCGSAGCALGELPVVWPDDWYFGPCSVEGGSNYSVRLKPRGLDIYNSMYVNEGACKWFELSEDELFALFYADHELKEDSPIEVLTANATAEQVADRFIAFVKWREEQVAQENKNAS